MTRVRPIFTADRILEWGLGGLLVVIGQDQECAAISYTYNSMLNSSLFYTYIWVLFWMLTLTN